MLKEEFEYYLAHQSDLVKKYNGRFIIIMGSKVVGDHDTFETALFDCQKKYKAGTYLIQRCLPGEESHTQTFHTRAIFHNA